MSRFKQPASLEARVKVVDGEVIIYWHDDHLNHNPTNFRGRSPTREKVANLRDVTSISRDFSVTKGKFRLHYRKEVCEATSTDDGCYFHGEHLVSQEFRSRVCMTRVVI